MKYATWWSLSSFLKCSMITTAESSFGRLLFNAKPVCGSSSCVYKNVIIMIPTAYSFTKKCVQ